MGGPGGPPFAPPCTKTEMGGPGVIMGGPWGGLEMKYGGAWRGPPENGQCGKICLYTHHTLTPEHPNFRYIKISIGLHKMKTEVISKGNK